MKILEKTITEMPKSFTSHEFNKQAIKNGYPAEKLKRKGLANFIRKYADNAYEHSKMWTKRDEKNNIMSEYKTNNTMSDDEIIKYLKSKGYKIMKPVKDWIEC